MKIFGQTRFSPYTYNRLFPLRSIRQLDTVSDEWNLLSPTLVLDVLVLLRVVVRILRDKRSLTQFGFEKIFEKLSKYPQTQLRATALRPFPKKILARLVKVIQ